MLLVGASGSGKTTVLTACIDRIPERSATTFVCGSEPLREVPFGALAAAVQHVPSVPLLEAQLLAHLMNTLREAPGRRGRLVCVDDVHLLDAASAGALEQLVRRGEIRVLMTHPAEDVQTPWLDALIRGGWLTTRELAPLDAAGLIELTRSELGGAVDLTTVAELHELSGGNVLQAMNILRASVQAGRLAENMSVWTATGPLEPSDTAMRGIDQRLVGLSATARESLELLTTIDSIELDVLATYCAAPCLESLEQADLIRIEHSGRRAIVQLRDRAVADRVARVAPATRRRRTSRVLADAIRTTGARRDSDLLHLARLDLESGRTISSEVAVAAARRALLSHETALAQRLADVALQTDETFSPSLVAGQIAFAAGDLQRADDLLKQAGELATSEREVVEATIARSAVLSLGGGSGEPAIDLIAEVLRVMQDPACIAELQAELSRISLMEGRWDDSAQIGGHALVASAAGEATTTVQLATVTAQVMAGNFITAGEGAIRALASSTASGPSSVMTNDRLELAQADALLFAGRLSEVGEIANRRLRALRRTDDTMVLGAWWLISAHVHMFSGRIDVARSAFRRSVFALESNDPLGLLFRARASEGLGAAHAGDLEAVTRALESFAGRPAPASYRTQVLVARVGAWKQALEGELEAAANSAMTVGLAALDRHHFAVATVAMYDAVRFGHPSAALRGLTDLAAGFEGALSPLLAHHASALVDEDGDALDQVAQRFEDMGALLVAAEARTNAATAHRDHGRVAESAASRTCADRLLLLCSGARTPALSAASPLLTPRQDQIARLAIRHRNDEIAEMLHISVRTVESHLDAAYQQLGIHSRDEIAAILGPG